MPRINFASVIAAIAMSFAPVGFCLAQDESYKPEVKGATQEPEKAQKSLKVAPGFKVDLFAAEPLLANPVAFHIDEKGRFYVVETFRHSDGVTDTRGHMNWLDDDLKSRTVADRVAMYKKYSTPEEFLKYSREQDRIRLIEDTDGDGKADKATIFADGFNLPETGLGAGVLSHKWKVYFTCIPDLWLLEDTDGDKKADVRTSLHSGYGVHVGFLGHDLHGLIFGPDGKLYFSIGDRGFNVRTIDGKHMTVPDTGSVLRCDPDGKNLEVVAIGLRNPQELAFTETGDLFTVDNNSDGGDKARLVHIIEGGDSGWRIGYQFIERPNSRGIWNSEKMWHPQWNGQAASIIPPLVNFTDGPSGLTYYPGTGLNSTQKGRFYISDFRGAANTSGIRSFKLKPKGPTFEIDDPQEFLWGFEVTDCDFGPDGALYATDWVQGWNKNGKGRIWKVTDASDKKDPALAETQGLIAAGTESVGVKDLLARLSYPDYRVRQAAQFALAEKAKPFGGSNPAWLALVEAASRGETIEARLHGIWGAGQVLRASSEPGAIGVRDVLGKPLAGLLTDASAEVRAQAAKTLGSLQAVAIGDLLPLLKDSNPRVRLFTLLGIRGYYDPAAVPAIVELLRTEDGRDPYFRSAARRALVDCYTRDTEGPKAVKAFADDPSPNVRMAILLALRLRDEEAVGRYLDDSEPAIVLEAARAIVESHSRSVSLPKLAALTSRATLSEPLARRVIAACEAIRDAKGLVAIATRQDLPESVRVEAVELLGQWTKPSHRHPITGLYRDIANRPAERAVAAFLPALPKLVAGSPDRVRRAATKAAAELKIKDAAPTLRALVADLSQPAESRVEALKALDALADEKLGEVAHSVMKDADPSVRVEAVRAVAKSNPDEAMDVLHGMLDHGTILEKQGAFGTLAEIKKPKADDLLRVWLDKLASGEVPPEMRLDLTEAAASRNLKDKLAKYESTISKDAPLAVYRDSLAGGNAARGRRVFREKAEVQCLRCHKVEGDGGEVGPELTGISAKKDRAYLLESIILPNKQIAQGFETTLLAKKDGQVVTGIVKSQDDKEIRLITAEGKLVTVLKSEIDETTRGSSAMPEDVIKNLTKSELRDVIEFLMSTKPAPVGH